jgi:glycosyltransferase involved in cell wall biosynthesis
MRQVRRTMVRNSDGAKIAMQNGRISIITPTLNRQAMLELAIDSVRAQKCPNVEHIVVDGGSTDGTLPWLAAQEDIILIEDRGRGLYDAINQGLLRVTGDYIGLLNSDDLYAVGAFEAVRTTFDANPNVDAVCGFSELFDRDQVLARYQNPRDLELDAHAAILGHCITNARFFRRSVFNRVGHFSMAYPRAADRDFLVRCLAAGIRFLPIQKLFYSFRSHAGSLTFADPRSGNEDLYLELLELAQDLQRRHLPAEILAKARVLEGRCVVALTAKHLRGGFFGRAAALFKRNGQFSAAPIHASVAAVLDRYATRNRDELEFEPH